MTFRIKDSRKKYAANMITSCQHFEFRLTFATAFRRCPKLFKVSECIDKVRILEYYWSDQATMVGYIQFTGGNQYITKVKDAISQLTLCQNHNPAIVMKGLLRKEGEELDQRIRRLAQQGQPIRNSSFTIRATAGFIPKVHLVPVPFQEDDLIEKGSFIYNTQAMNRDVGYFGLLRTKRCVTPEVISQHIKHHNLFQGLEFTFTGPIRAAQWRNIEHQMSIAKIWNEDLRYNTNEECINAEEYYSHVNWLSCRARLFEHTNNVYLNHESPQNIQTRAQLQSNVDRAQAKLSETISGLKRDNS